MAFGSSTSRSISSARYRPDGPNCHRPAFDDVIQGESGIADMMGRNAEGPRYIPMVMADKLCGHVLASAVGMALFDRERSGLGSRLAGFSQVFW